MGLTLEYARLTPLQRRIAREYDLTFDEVMRKLYVEEEMTMSEIAKLLDVNIKTIQRWLKDCNIQSRKMMWV